VLVVVAEVNGKPEPDRVTQAIGTAVSRDFELPVTDVLLVPPQGTVRKTSSSSARPPQHLAR
jgi:hypothetical protein